MRLIHEVIEDLRGRPDEDGTPLGAALEELLGGERGSLPELADRFTEAGLAEVMASWIGNGPNLPISTSDLRRVLGEERAEDLATLAGLDVRGFSCPPGAVAARGGASHDAGRRLGNAWCSPEATPWLKRQPLMHELDVLETRRIAGLALDARKVRDRLLEKVPDADLGEPEPARGEHNAASAIALNCVLASKPEFVALRQAIVELPRDIREKLWVVMQIGRGDAAVVDRDIALATARC